MRARSLVSACQRAIVCAHNDFAYAYSVSCKPVVLDLMFRSPVSSCCPPSAYRFPHIATMCQKSSIKISMTHIRPLGSRSDCALYSISKVFCKSRVKELTKRLRRSQSESWLEKNFHVPKLLLSFLNSNATLPSCTRRGACDYNTTAP